MFTQIKSLQGKGQALMRQEYSCTVLTNQASVDVIDGFHVRVVSPRETVLVIFGWRMIFRNCPLVDPGCTWRYVIVPFLVSLRVIIIESTL